MTDPRRLLAAFEKARADLLLERSAQGHWIGELSNSALSTATAVSALTLVERHSSTDRATGRFLHESHVSRLSGMIVRGLHWLADHQNDDGGWGDTDKSHSNIATTMLAVAAFRLTAVPADHVDMLDRAESYIKSQDGISGLRRRYGKDKTFAAPILTNCALAGMAPWSEVSPLPFEAACVPQKFYRFLRLPVVSYAIPALVAIGQARYFHLKPWNPLTRLVRAAAAKPSLRVLEHMQPSSGGYLEAVPLTSFVVMALASIGHEDHPVTQRGVEFLQASMRPDGSWPIDTNLATWNTTLAINALAAAGDDVADLECLGWLLSCQYRDVHPFTGADPGGWGWSDLSGAVPDADDTPGALLALAHIYDSPNCGDQERARISDAAAAGVNWLLDLQNRDGGWPTFCRGWGNLPFDRSGADLTAHALRAIHAWSTIWSNQRKHAAPEKIKLGAITGKAAANRMTRAIAHGGRYLRRQQREDGSWLPLWFGNQDHPAEENPVYGTSKVLLGIHEGRHRDAIDTRVWRRGLTWLKQAQNRDGGWGGGPLGGKSDKPNVRSSVEETALAVDTLLTADEPSLESVVSKGLDWLVEAVETSRHREAAPIGFYFAKLWYHERLYPLIFTVSALGRAIRRDHLARHAHTESKPATARLAGR